MLVADYGKEGAADWRRVVYDPDAGTVTFYNCYQSKRFLAWGAGADPEFTCRVSEIRAVYWSYQHNIESILLIITPAGQVRIPQKAVGLDGVRSALIGGLAPESRLRWYEYEAAKTVLIIAFTLGAAILGILLIVKTDVLNHQSPVEFEQTTVYKIFIVITFLLCLSINVLSYEYEAAKTVPIIAFTLGAAILGILLIVKTDVLNHQSPVVVIFYVIPLFLNLIINWRGKSM